MQFRIAATCKTVALICSPALLACLIASAKQDAHLTGRAWRAAVRGHPLSDLTLQHYQILRRQPALLLFGYMLDSKRQTRSSLDWPGNGTAGVGNKVAVQAVVRELSQGVPDAQVSEAAPIHNFQQVFVVAWSHINRPCARRGCVQVDPVHPRLCSTAIRSVNCQMLGHATTCIHLYSWASLSLLAD